jgi:penicillin-binding protein 1A
VFVGYKDPRPMGSAATGGGLAAPIAADVFETALAGGAYTAFAPPPGMEVFPVDRTTGLADYSGGPNVVFEAFKPGTAPPNEGSTFNPGFQNGATQAPVTLGGAPLSSGPSIQEIQSSISTGSGVF